MAKLNQARRNLIAKLRRDGKTFEEIGKLLDPPVSKQAAYDTARKFLPRYLTSRRPRV